MAKLRFHDLTISAVRVDTASSVELSFDIPPALASDFVFEPGQYLTLRAVVDGQDLRRSYSICSPLGAPQLSVGIKRIEGGAFSSFALGLQPADVLQPGVELDQVLGHVVLAEVVEVVVVVPVLGRLADDAAA
ncbi:MAG: hypothetical protein CML51_01720, partial [Rhodobacteraceae bacterium]|nr:hypothetical protein [Paracoccaceae bacterium]